MPAFSKREKVAIKLSTDYWSLSSDSIILEKIVTLNIIPDGSLEQITANIKTFAGIAIQGVNITVDNDTTVTADKKGTVNILLPAKFQKSNYTLYFEKKDYQPVQEYYYPKSGILI